MSGHEEQEAQPRAFAAGTITKLVAQKKNPDRVSVFLDGAFAFGVHQDLVLEYGLHAGLHLDVKEQERLVAADRMLGAKARALHYLAYRPRTEHEVRQKLLRSDYAEDVVESVIARLHELRYLDDATYAHDYVRSRFASRGYGPRRLQTELRRRGVRPALIEAALDEFIGADDALDAARTHAAKRWPRLAKEEDPFKRRKKLTDFLLRRGFGYDTVRRVVEELEEGK